MEEIWKDIIIEGEPITHMVSNLHGRIKSLSRTVACRGGVRVIKEKILKLNFSAGRYPMIQLKKRGKLFLVHRLVAIAHVPNPENKPQVNHKNGIKSDPSAENPEWSTGSENMIHAFKTGLQSCPFTGIKGKDHHGAKKIIQMDMDGNELKVWDSMADAEREGTFKTSGIGQCCLGNHKSHKGFKWKYAA